MAKTSVLPTIVSLAGPERLPVVQNGETRGASMADLRDYFGDLLGGWHQGNTGETGRDASELARQQVFCRADATLVTGQTVFVVPFEFLPNVAFVTLNGESLTAGTDYGASAGLLTLTRPIGDGNDDLIANLWAFPSIQDAQALNIRQLSVAKAKLAAGTATTLALYGTSLTYSQDTTSGTTTASTNGAAQTRSIQTFDANLTEALQAAGCVVTITNRGYPGDSSAQLLTRWAGASRKDIANFECGHNDAIITVATDW